MNCQYAEHRIAIKNKYVAYRKEVYQSVLHLLLAKGVLLFTLRTILTGFVNSRLDFEHVGYIIIPIILVLGEHNDCSTIIVTINRKYK